MERCRGILVAVALGALMFAGGCSQAGARDGVGEPQTASLESTEVVYANVIDSTEGTAPVLTYREYKVPGWGSLDGYGERLATISYSPQVQGDPTRLRVLDFRTGKSREIVSEGVGFKDGFDILDAWSSDEWVAWEELNPRSIHLSGNHATNCMAAAWMPASTRITFSSCCATPMKT